MVETKQILYIYRLPRIVRIVAPLTIPLVGFAPIWVGIILEVILGDVQLVTDDLRAMVVVSLVALGGSIIGIWGLTTRRSFRITNETVDIPLPFPIPGFREFFRIPFQAIKAIWIHAPKGEIDPDTYVGIVLYVAEEFVDRTAPPMVLRAGLKRFVLPGDVALGAAPVLRAALGDEGWDRLTSVHVPEGELPPPHLLYSNRWRTRIRRDLRQGP
jgi:hypothetical protein